MVTCRVRPEGLSKATSLWPWLNPWSAPCALIGREKVCSTPFLFGYWPATFGLALFLWFDLAWPAPRDPYHVAVILVLYWSVHFVAQMILGAGWRSRSETFTVLFDLVGQGVEVPKLRAILVRERRESALPFLPQLLVQGLSRFQIEDYTAEKPYLKARMSQIKDVDEEGKETEALTSNLVSQFSRVIELSPASA